jgi:hypothetical protein
VASRHVRGWEVTAAELISMLSEVDPDQQVLIWDADSEEMQPVTGCTHSSGEPTKLYSDEP